MGYLRKIFNKIITVVTLSFFYPAVYGKYSHKPIEENKVIFLINSRDELPSSFHCIYDKLYSQTDFALKCHFLRNGSVSKKEYIANCSRFIIDLATAKYVFMDEATHITSKINIRNETLITQLWHGCGAFKKFGYSTCEAGFGASKKTMDRYPPNKNYSLVTVSSPEVIPFFEEAMGYEDKKGIIKATGCSRTDIFYDKDFIEKSQNRLYELIPTATKKKVILYAPTFRGNVESAASPDKLDIQEMSKRLSDEYILLLKHHPVVKRRPSIPTELNNSFAYDVTDKMSIEELICVSDVCISDYSSLIFEYSLFLKPLIFFAYDLKDYYNERGFYYPYRQLTPGPVLNSTADITDYIKSLPESFSADPIKAFRDKFMSACDGKATDRIISEVFGEHYEEYKKESPLPRNDYHGFTRSSQQSTLDK